MYICICKQVTDSAIKNAADNGATKIKHLAKTLELGTQCGKCCCHAKAILAAHAQKTTVNREDIK